jgi:hypothetical protein
MRAKQRWMGTHARTNTHHSRTMHTNPHTFRARIACCSASARCVGLRYALLERRRIASLLRRVCACAACWIRSWRTECSVLLSTSVERLNAGRSDNDDDCISQPTTPRTYMAQNTNERDVHGVSVTHTHTQTHYGYVCAGRRCVVKKKKQNQFVLEHK